MSDWQLVSYGGLVMYSGVRMYSVVNGAVVRSHVRKRQSYPYAENKGRRNERDQRQCRSRQDDVQDKDPLSVPSLGLVE